MGEQKTLTLEQVKDAREFAWHAPAYIYADGVFVGLDHTGSASEADDEVGGIRIQVSITRAWEVIVSPEMLARLADDWHHTDGCDCDFCSA